jgi:hypothetical protein
MGGKDYEQRCFSLIEGNIVIVIIRRLRLSGIICFLRFRILLIGIDTLRLSTTRIRLALAIILALSILAFIPLLAIYSFGNFFFRLRALFFFLLRHI